MTEVHSTPQNSYVREQAMSYEEIAAFLKKEFLNHLEWERPTACYISLGRVARISLHQRSLSIESPNYPYALPTISAIIPLEQIGSLQHLKFPADELVVRNLAGYAIAYLTIKQPKKVMRELIDMTKEQVG